jgi:hypothetical protein
MGAAFAFPHRFGSPHNIGPPGWLIVHFRSGRSAGVLGGTRTEVRSTELWILRTSKERVGWKSYGHVPLEPRFYEAVLSNAARAARPFSCPRLAAQTNARSNPIQCATYDLDGSNTRIRSTGVQTRQDEQVLEGRERDGAWSQNRQNATSHSRGVW